MRSIDHRHKLHSSVSSVPGSSSGSTTSPASEEFPSDKYATYQYSRDLPLVGFQEPAIQDDESAVAVLPPLESFPGYKGSPISQRPLQGQIHGQVYGAPRSVPGTIKPASDEIAINFFFVSEAKLIIMCRYTNVLAGAVYF